MRLEFLGMLGVEFVAHDEQMRDAMSPVVIASVFLYFMVFF